MKIRKGMFKVGRGLWLNGAERAPDGYMDPIDISYFTEGPNAVLICVARGLGFDVWCRSTQSGGEIIMERRGVTINVGGNCAPESFDPEELFQFARDLISYCRRKPRGHVLWDAEECAAPEWATVTISDDAQGRIDRASSAWLRKRGYAV